MLPFSCGQVPSTAHDNVHGQAGNGAEARKGRSFLMEIDALDPSTSLRAVSLSNRCDVIVQEWRQFTGRKAERTQGGEATNAR